MATRYFVITGHSLTERSRCWFPEGEAKRKKFPEKFTGDQDECDFYELFTLAKADRDLVLLGPELLGEMEDKGESQYSKTAKALTLRFDPECWNEGKKRLLPAELATLLMINHERAAPGRIGSNDHIYFLSGDNLPVDGQSSTLPVAYLMASVLERIVTSPIRDVDHTLGIDAGHIHVHPRAFNWDPANAEVFERSMQEVIGFIRDNREGNTLALVLTGGYKAIGQRLAFALGKVRSFNALLYYLHEESNQLILMQTEDLREQQDFNEGE